MENIDVMRELKTAYKLNNQDIADICGVSIFTVRSWMLPEKSLSSRNLRDKELDYFKMKLRNKRKPK